MLFIVYHVPPPVGPKISVDRSNAIILQTNDCPRSWLETLSLDLLLEMNFVIYIIMRNYISSYLTSLIEFMNLYIHRNVLTTSQKLLNGCSQGALSSSTNDFCVSSLLHSAATTQSFKLPYNLSVLKIDALFVTIEKYKSHVWTC